MKCPICGNEVTTPIKEWFIQRKSGKGPKVRVRLYECCGKKFRECVREPSSE